MVKCLAAASLLAAAGFGFAMGTLTSVAVDKVGAGVEVKLTGTGLEKPRVERAMRNATYIVSFSGVLKTTGRRVNVNHGGVTSVQWTQFTSRPPVTRIVVRLRPTDNPTLVQTQEGWVIRVNMPAPATAAPTQPTPDRPIIMLDPPKPEPKPIDSSTKSTVTDISNPLIQLTETDRKLPRVTGNASPATDNAPRVVESATAVQSKRISLDFVDTDVVQILKALAAQADVNIVTSPDVKGEISVSLRNVTADEALNVVTAIAGLKFSKVDRTIVVAPPNRLGDIVRNISAGQPAITGAMDTRIVPLYSRQGQQVKAALYRVLPQDARGGRYEVVLPSENLVDAAPAAANTQGNAPSSATTSNTKPDEYIMVFGTKSRLEEVERMIRTLDEQIAGALGIETPKSSMLVTETYLVNGSKASDLLKAVGAKENMVGSVMITATPEGSSARQTLVLTGRENEVKRLLNTFKELDGGERPEDEFMIYEVRFSDPRALKDELSNQIPGIRASIPPAGAGATRVYVPSTGKVKSADGGEESGASATTTTAAAATIEKSDGLKSGLALPFSSLEPSAVPMRIVLRGDKTQIKRATDLLNQLDNTPRQLAIEVRVMELTKVDAVNAGIDWNLFTGGAVQFLRLNNSVANPNNSIGVNINDRNVSGDVTATLDGIANKNNLIARPNMIAYDGRESELFIGDVIRYVESITSSQNGPSVQIGEVRVGVNLAVLPRISSEGVTTLDIRPTVSFLREFRQYQVSGFTAELPQTSERQTQQTLTIRDGETIAIGGLITEEMTRNTTGVPILMDLPILGNFFRSTRTNKTKRELVVFITSKVVLAPLGSAGDVLPMRQPVPAPTTGGRGN